MATLENPLDKYQTYNVHYVLLAGRTTEDLKNFTDEQQNSATLAAIEKVQLLGEPVPFGNTESAFLVMDTRRFSQFTIDSLKYEVLINGIEKPGNSTGNVATLVEMTVLDSIGVSFINFLQYLMDEKMNTNFDGIIFLLRIIFVGVDANGVSETVQAVTIPMHLFRLELNLDYSKGAYTIEFMPNTNFDTQKHARWLNISTASSYFTGAENKLGGLVNSFERALNSKSSEFYNKVNSIVEKFDSSDPRSKRAKTKNNNFGRLVQYSITIPEKWEEFTFTGAASGGSTETIFKKQLLAAEQAAKEAAEKRQADIEKSKAEAKRREEAGEPPQAPEEAEDGKPTDSYMSASAGTTITHVLDLMFKQVAEIADLSAGRKTAGPDGTVTFYKHFVGITSDDELIIVHVDVVVFRVPNVLVEKNKTPSTTQTASDFYQPLTVDGRRIPKNYAEFDYIFTGKNKDILNFDLKFQDLQFMLASNLALGAAALSGVTEYGQKDGESKINPQSELIQSRAYDPILLPQNTDEELRNFTNYSSLRQKATTSDNQLIKSIQDGTRNLSMFYASAPITAAITIRGNPLIMMKFNTNQFLPHVVTTTNQGPGGITETNLKNKKDYRKSFENQILRDNTSAALTPGQNVQIVRQSDGSFLLRGTLGDANYTTSPVFVKINIKGPNVDFISNDLIHGEDFAKEVLYDNYYVIMKVTNIIEGAVFKQELELFSHNVFGHGKLSAADKATKNLR